MQYNVWVKCALLLIGQWAAMTGEWGMNLRSRTLIYIHLFNQVYNTVLIIASLAGL